MSAHVDVNMWRVTPEGDVQTTGWAYDPEETVFELMNKTKSWWDWKNYRLAYGAGELFSEPRLVQWAQISIADTIEYNYDYAGVFHGCNFGGRRGLLSNDFQTC